MPPICIDIDNVLAQTDEVVRRLIREHSGEGVDLSHEDIIVFDYWRCRDANGKMISREEWEAIHDKFLSHHLLDIAPSPGAQAILNRLSKTFDLHLVTSRPQKSREHTVEWLRLHKIPYHALDWTRHGEKHLLNTAFLAAVDDDREQGYAFHSKGIHSFLLAHPWNQLGPHSSLVRVKTLKEFSERVLKLPAQIPHQ